MGQELSEIAAGKASIKDGRHRSGFAERREVETIQAKAADTKEEGAVMIEL